MLQEGSARTRYEAGVRDGVAEAMMAYLEAHDAIPRGVSVKRSDIREGVLAVVSVLLSEPQFQGQTKDKLNNAEIRGLVSSMVRKEVEGFMHGNPSTGNVVALRIIQACRGDNGRAIRSQEAPGHDRPAHAARDLGRLRSHALRDPHDTLRGITRIEVGRGDHPRTGAVDEGVVSGVGGYGNCLGLPNIGGEAVFAASYLGNPLVNALAVGVLRHEDLHLANATGVGNHKRQSIDSGLVNVGNDGLFVFES